VRAVPDAEGFHYVEVARVPVTARIPDRQHKPGRTDFAVAWHAGGGPFIKGHCIPRTNARRSAKRWERFHQRWKTRVSIRKPFGHSRSARQYNWLDHAPDKHSAATEKRRARSTAQTGEMAEAQGAKLRRCPKLRYAGIMKTLPGGSQNFNSRAPSYIEATPKVCGGKPRVRGTRIRVQDIALWHERLGLSAGEIVSRFPQLSLAAVDAALTYYRDHLSEIQLPIDSADALAKEVTAHHHSRLPGILPRAE